MEPPLWLYPEPVISKLGTDYADEIRSRQQTIIAMLLSANTLYNLHNEELRSSKPYPVVEYLDDVFNMVWKPLTNKNEEINDFRRHLQRAYVDFLGLSINPNELNKATSTTAHRSDAIIYLEQHLDKLEQYLQQQPNTPHYKNLKLRVKKIREKYESAK
jgi:hypothetical protein